MSDTEDNNHEIKEDNGEEEEHTPNEEVHEQLNDEANEEPESPDLDREVKEDSDDEEFVGFADEEIKPQPKKRQIISDDSDSEIETIKKVKQTELSEPNDDRDGQEKETDLENENSDDQEIAAEQGNDEESGKSNNDESSSDEELVSRKEKKGVMTDLEMALNKQKAENRKKNNRKKNADSEELTDIENTISAIITEMKNVAAEDREANEKLLTAVHKFKMLPTVINLLKKSDHHATMIELGILSAISEWLAPLPDKSLPNIKIRETLIDALRDFGEINSDYLKSSGIGKAVMYLFKHSNETKANKLKLEKLIHNWSRPIFNLDANFKHLTKEERMQRDMEHVKTLNRRSSEDVSQQNNVDEFLNPTNKFKNVKKNKPKEESDRSEAEETNKFLRPGDAGFCPRARVPVPSAKDYIIRPKSNVENSESSNKKVKKTESRIEKHQKKFIELKKNSKFQRAVTMKISGKD